MEIRRPLSPLQDMFLLCRKCVLVFNSAEQLDISDGTTHVNGNDNCVSCLKSTTFFNTSKSSTAVTSKPTCDASSNNTSADEHSRAPSSRRTNNDERSISSKRFNVDECDCNGVGHSKRTRVTSKNIINDVRADSSNSIIISPGGYSRMFGDERLKTCSECYAFAKKYFYLLAHERVHLNLTEYSCSKCVSVFSFKKGLSEHMKTHAVGETPYQCKCSSVETVTVSDEIQQDADHKRKMAAKKKISSTGKEQKEAIAYKCNECSFEVRRKDVLNKHVQMHLKEKSYTCLKCLASFANRIQLMMHMTQKHTATRAYKCGRCDKTFGTAIEVNAHRAEHSSNQPIRCEKCGTTFKTTNGLKYFHKCNRGGAKPFSCDHCTDAFLSAGDLLFHVKALHTQEGQLMCEKCRYSFKSSDDLREHYKLKHVTLHKCEYCVSRSFRSFTNLQSHINRFHYNLRTYKCKICESFFPTSGDLQRHLSMHGYSTPFQCDFCPAKYKTKVGLQRHVNRSHSTDVP